MQNEHDLVFKNIQRYKRKFYLNLLLRGLIWSLAIILTIFLVITFAEYVAWFSKAVRTALFFGFVLSAAIALFQWVLLPLYKLFTLDRSFPDERAATEIGSSFPDVRDKLLNLLQLQKRFSLQKDSLLEASIRQKSGEIGPVSFDSAIHYGTNTRYLQYLIPAVLLLLGAWVFVPALFTDSARRIVNFSEDFAPEAPFKFVLQNQNLQAFKNEDYTLQLKIEGDTRPKTAFIVLNGRKIKLQDQAAGIFSYTIPKVQENKNLRFEAAGFSSSSYTLEVVERPSLQNFQVELVYPSYLQKNKDRLSNVGNFQVPEGTEMNWQFKTSKTDSIKISFTGLEKEDTLLQSTDNQLINYRKKAKGSVDYELALFNRWSGNKDPIKYHIEVIPDQHPVISLNPFADTTMFKYIVLGGNVADDYGLTRLQIIYRLNRSGKDAGEYKSIRLPLQRSQTSQSYFYRWDLDSMNIRKGDQLEYFVKVWDNDEVNGYKPARTASHVLNIPDAKKFKEAITRAEQNAESGINESIKEAQNLEQKIKKAEERLKGKNKVNYQDEKQLREILEDREKIEEQLRELQQKTEALKQQKEQLGEKQNEKIKEKAEQLQQLMEELLDEETKRLYEELEKLLQEKRQSEDFQNVLDQLSNKEKNLEKELERALEMFKRLKYEDKLDKTIQKIEELSKEQEKLSEETGNKKSEQQQEDLLKQQEELSEEFEEIKKETEELDKLNQELKRPNPTESLQEEKQNIEEQQKESKESLEKGKNNKAQKSQKNAAEEMKKMAKKMEQMQGGMQMQQMQENLDNLRHITDNLIKLSFSQEELMKEFREINQSNPRFVNLGQEQLKIKDDAVILEDSLRSLAERVFQIRTFVTREVNDMNKYLDESVNAIKERKKGVATGKQQFSMTSMNNLALLLDDILQQMQQQMADAMGMPQKGGQQKKDGEGMPGLSELQKQLNERISQLKKSGKTGRELSEELARMAAEQEQIRQALKKAEEKYGPGEKGNTPGNGGLPEQMEETESDLVNKKITRELIERQQQILTRLLETEKAMREREQDEERKGETAKDYEKRLPEAFEEYLRQKEKETELLKSVPPRLHPYYKKEVDNYFKRIGL